jgi:hypothetical protein
MLDVGICALFLKDATLNYICYNNNREVINNNRYATIYKLVGFDEDTFLFAEDKKTPYYFSQYFIPKARIDLPYSYILIPSDLKNNIKVVYDKIRYSKEVIENTTFLQALGYLITQPVYFSTIAYVNDKKINFVSHPLNEKQINETLHMLIEQEQIPSGNYTLVAFTDYRNLLFSDFAKCNNVFCFPHPYIEVKKGLKELKPERNIKIIKPKDNRKPLILTD